MKRPSAINTKVHEDSSDLLGNTAPSSSQTYLDEPVSPSNNNGATSDNESVSDSSRLRKKRNTYQKISDDIRVNLLEAVQNGETLKAAAKRHKINYSSAKSILHTYRKEGRILKKSAQERTIKRKGESSPDYKDDPKPMKQCKKENMQPTSTDGKVSKPISMLTDKKPLAQSASNTQNENSQTTTIGANSKSTIKSTGKDEKSTKGSNEAAKSQTTQQNTQKGEDAMNSQTLPERAHGDQVEMNNTGNIDTNQNLNHRTKRFDSFQAFMGAHLAEAGGDHSIGGYDQQHMFTDPFNDMMNSLHNRNHPHDDIYNGNNMYFFPPGFGNSGALEDKTSKIENGIHFEDFQFADCPLKSFMDTQNLFREALRKASFFSQGNAGGRKDSIDFFKM